LYGGQFGSARSKSHSVRWNFTESSFMRAHVWPLVLAIIALSACATSSPNGRMRLTAPPSVSAVYSDVDMQLHLAAANTNAPCAGVECQLNRGFDQQVLRLGSRLAQSAFDAYPDLSKRISGFEFIVAEKAEPGSTSNATGTVVIFRGVQKLRLDEETLAFLIACEMGHVIGRHHDENSATIILFSVLAQALLPVANLIRGATALIQASSATWATTSAASFIGSRITIESYKSDQLHEADTIALNLLARRGWNNHEIDYAQAASKKVAGDDNWSKDIHISAAVLNKLSEN